MKLGDHVKTQVRVLLSNTKGTCCQTLIYSSLCSPKIKSRDSIVMDNV